MIESQTISTTETPETKDVRTRIAEHLKQNGIKKSWLADQCNCSNGHLSQVLSCDRPLTDELKAKIETALKINF